MLPLGHCLVGDLLAPRVAGLRRLASEVVERLPLHVDDVAELLGDVVVDAAEVVLLEAVAPAAGAASPSGPSCPGCARRCGPGSRSSSAGAAPR